MTMCLSLRIIFRLSPPVGIMRESAQKRDPVKQYSLQNPPFAGSARYLQGGGIQKYLCNTRCIRSTPVMLMIKRQCDVHTSQCANIQLC